MSGYAEHDKLDTDEAASVVKFQEWLDEHDLFVAKVVDGHLILDESTKPSTLLTDFLGVDREKLEDERKQMLEELRKLNTKGPMTE
ncbi:hypothetical protein SEA_TIMINATOR_62 [Arthrobacter phage Timinator]|uniref:Uncharacterized protein n=3 Tax=Marthavirus barretlemon TaxID=2560300 RepID=A0A386KPV7_9CAUD|nr:hypothetical protein SEA_TIMINATOR_62 [Arthrobacter phage Timinator]AYD86533.1 hypothetical protein SEA_LEEROYJ_62 [Arthrobacter phage LeeroyJ]QJD53392.1 hypothetical protein SEA_STEVIEBAY_62 [Arthrobacter phage StevieBAY]